MEETKNKFSVNTLFMDWLCMYHCNMQYAPTGKKVYVTFPNKNQEGKAAQFPVTARGAAALIYHAATSEMFNGDSIVMLRRVCVKDVVIAQIAVDRPVREVILFFDTTKTTAVQRYQIRKELLEALVLSGWSTYINFDGTDHRSFTEPVADTIVVSAQSVIRRIDQHEVS